MADLTARRDSLLDYLPGDWQQAVNTSPVVNALSRMLNKPTPDLEGAARRQYGPQDELGSIADKEWLERQAAGPSWFERNPSAADGVNKLGLLANFLGPGVKLPAAAPKPTGIRAYHGSPHDFDRFDISKIGTGEGAQAYGPGLYFAESEGVAKSYRDALGGKGFISPYAQSMLSVSGSNIDAALSAIKARVRNPGRFPLAKDEERQALIAISELTDMKLNGALTGPGRMYEVNIKADPDQFLDWDKPLAQQPEGVKRTIEPALKAAALDLGKGASPEVIARFEAMGLKNVADRMRPKEIDPWSLDTVTLAQQYPNALRDAGIPGIKYLDQQSRAAGQGSRNYVVLDDKLIEILRKYGLLPPVAAGTAAALNQQEPPL